MRRYAGLACALALALSPLAAAPAPAAAPDGVRPSADTRARMVAKLRERIPQLASKTVRTNAAVWSQAELYSVGDLDGDGAEELADSRIVIDDSNGTETETAMVNLHRGRDGKLLWSKTYPTTSYASALPAKVGADGTPGVVVVAYSFDYVDAAAQYGLVVDTKVNAIDLRGSLVWEQEFQGAYSGGVVDVMSATFVDGLLDANPGGGTEVLVTTVNGWLAGAGPAYVSQSTALPIILDGSTGAPRPLTPVATLSPEPISTPAGDLDGDKRDDVVVAGNLGRTSGATALKGADGTVLWVNRELPSSMMVFPRSIADATGDGVRDLTVSTSFLAGPPLFDLGEMQAALVDGKTGALKWTKPGLGAYGMGNADRKPGSEVGIAEFLEDDDKWGVRFTVYDAAGKAIWSVSRSLVVDFSGSGMLSALVGITGDMNADGTIEAVYELILESRIDKWDAGTLDGRTGRVRKLPGRDTWPVGAAVDGRGVDSVTVKKGKGKIDVVAWRGDSGKKLWRATIPTAGTSFPYSWAARIDRDRCADVVVATSKSGTSTEYVLSGATGKPLWSLTRTLLGAPKVTRFAVKGQTRYVRTC